MAYESYKVIHLAAIFVFLAGVSVLLTARPRERRWKVITGISSFVILLGGMGLLARIGGGFPPWVQAKIVLWLVITGLGHVVSKRFPQRAGMALWVTVGLAICAAALAVYKPFHSPTEKAPLASSSAPDSSQSAQ